MMEKPRLDMIWTMPIPSLELTRFRLNITNALTLGKSSKKLGDSRCGSAGRNRIKPRLDMIWTMPIPSLELSPLTLSVISRG
jgi:hypothetical protein